MGLACWLYKLARLSRDIEVLASGRALGPRLYLRGRRKGKRGLGLI